MESYSTLHDSAVAYALTGVAVFPCVPGEKRPIISRGFLGATTDLDTVEAWWRRWPNANIAVPTGVAFDVLDVDNRPPTGDGFGALEALRRAGLLARVHRIVVTPSGGQHRYFATSGARSASLRDHFLDFKAAGGYVLVPPSVINGCDYRVVHERPERGPLDWQAVVALLRPATARPRVSVAEFDGLDGLVRTVAGARVGSRNAVLFWAACRAVEDGLDPAALVEPALGVGLGEREVRATIASAQRTAGAA